MIPESLAYGAGPAGLRGDLIAAHGRAWRRLARPGNWWSGHERLAIAAEVRHAPGCPLCADRQAVLSPNMVAGSHTSIADLPAPAIEAIHRIVSDASRLTERWYHGLLADGLSDGEYVELIAVLATVITIDGFTHALDLPRHDLPGPEAGEPFRQRPSGAKPGLAWVPTLAPEDVTAAEHGIYDGLAAVNIHRALSLVPNEVKGFFDLDSVHYLPDAKLRDFGAGLRAIDNAQIELLAARVSAINQCVY